METPKSTRFRRIRKAVAAAMNKISGPQETDNGTKIHNQAESEVIYRPRVLDFNNCEEDTQANESSSLDSGSDSGSDLALELDDVSKKEELRNWAIAHNITHACLRDLLKLHQKWLPDDNFPGDPRTLLKTPRRIESFNCAGGEYFYFGISQNLTNLLDEGINNKRRPNISKFENMSNLLTLTVGIDGLPLSKSSNKQLIINNALMVLIGAIEHLKETTRNERLLPRYKL